TKGFAGGRFSLRGRCCFAPVGGPDGYEVDRGTEPGSTLSASSIPCYANSLAMITVVVRMEWSDRWRGSTARYIFVVNPSRDRPSS
ncbi:MAG TPA: hypothetical protein VM347_06345, partial [Nonomuraea sp.]|nr:hypothetical protein [Nonomuraea sp.]